MDQVDNSTATDESIHLNERDTTMKKLSKTLVVVVTGLLVIATASLALATVTPATAVVNERVYNDCPISTLTVSNSYPSITIDDQKNFCGAGWANRHNWRFSMDGVSNQLFNNNDGFRMSATMTITGSGQCEAGLQISPWWSPNVDGMFNVRTTDGEIACFGGRLPFYSFTGSQGVTYTKGEAIYMEITYLPNSLTSVDPATIEYKLTYQSVTYSSGAIGFDEGNPAEPYGTWGMLDGAAAGGHLQFFLQEGAADANINVMWDGIGFEDLGSPVAIEDTSWGNVKALFR
jgi:hypothetical protein